MGENTEHLGFNTAKKSVFNYLKYRPRTEQEIVNKLRLKGFSDDLIKETVTYFKRIGSIDDALFAKIWTASRINKPVGVHRIRRELKQKGINEDLIHDAIQNASGDYEEHEAVLRLAKQQSVKYRHLEKQKARRRLYHFLCRRGFNTGIIIKIINNLT